MSLGFGNLHWRLWRCAQMKNNCYRSFPLPWSPCSQVNKCWTGYLLCHFYPSGRTSACFGSLHSCFHSTLHWAHWLYAVGFCRPLVVHLVWTQPWWGPATKGCTYTMARLSLMYMYMYMNPHYQVKHLEVKCVCTCTCIVYLYIHVCTLSSLYN